jgi:hypothetical protein
MSTPIPQCLSEPNEPRQCMLELGDADVAKIYYL